MTLKKVASISVAALMAAMMMTTAYAEDGKYVQNSDGKPVKNSSDECVKAQYGSMPEGCETAPPPPPPPVTPPPVTPPPAPPAPIQKMTLTSDANFDFDKATLKPAGQANLDQFLSGLAGAKVSGISVVGHTDSVGSDAYNQKLSEQRAAAVANYLAGKGVPAAAIQASGKGESQPVADNSTKAGRAANRRVEVEASGTR
ncbi:MAG: OmpA family protein [Candidatus Thiothrix putei]|uniref:OmpA family protein n=1 Tax=Candidatus Thiothrix putei TaxID=3080811 RepID=A0AA95HFT1_9GAMM|nr:MAG: OmpA family protein [Candidatus Thiothrix putei]